MHLPPMKATRLACDGFDIFEKHLEVPQSNYRFNSATSNGDSEFCVKSDENDSLQDLLIAVNAALDWNLMKSAPVRESINPEREDLISSLPCTLPTSVSEVNVVSTSRTTKLIKEPAKSIAASSARSSSNNIVANNENDKCLNLCGDSFDTAIEVTLGPLLPEDVITSLILRLGSNLSELSDNS
jgi:hypothetical protein